MTKAQIKERIIENGVDNLKEFGYPTVDQNNILTDRIFARFFLSMLNDKVNQVNNKDVTDVIEQLKAEVSANLTD